MRDQRGISIEALERLAPVLGLRIVEEPAISIAFSADSGDGLFFCRFCANTYEIEGEPRPNGRQLIYDHYYAAEIDDDTDAMAIPPCRRREFWKSSRWEIKNVDANRVRRGEIRVLRNREIEVTTDKRIESR